MQQSLQATMQTYLPEEVFPTITAAQGATLLPKV